MFICIALNGLNTAGTLRFEELEELLRKSLKRASGRRGRGAKERSKERYGYCWDSIIPFWGDYLLGVRASELGAIEFGRHANNLTMHSHKECIAIL